MIAIDSSVLIAVLRLEPGADLLLRCLVQANARVMSAMSLLETSMVIAGQRGTKDLWEPLSEFIDEAAIEIAPFDYVQALLARQAFLRFGKGRHPAALNLGDCASYALAYSRRIPLLFKGDDFTKTDIIAAYRP